MYHYVHAHIDPLTFFQDSLGVLAMLAQVNVMPCYLQPDTDHLTSSHSQYRQITAPCISTQSNTQSEYTTHTGKPMHAPVTSILYIFYTLLCTKFYIKLSVSVFRSG